MSRRQTTIRWGLAITAAFGVGALLAYVEKRESRDTTSSPKAAEVSPSIHAAENAEASTDASAASPTPPQAAKLARRVQPARRDAPVHDASEHPHANPAEAASTEADRAQAMRRARYEGRRQLPPGVAWSDDLAAASAEAREKNQLLLLFVGAYGET